jgi:CRP/FNR family transcriptional regulator, nitrogen fixation regulation protein
MERRMANTSKQVAAVQIPTPFLPASMVETGQPAVAGLPAAGGVLHYAQDRAIYRRGSDAGVFFRVVSGVVRTCTYFSNGRRQIEAFHFAGDVFGFEAGSTQNLSAEAVCGCTVLSYPWRGPGMPAVNARLSHQLLLHAMAGHAQSQRHSIMLGRGSAVEKVAAFMTECVRRSRDSHVVILPMTRQDIADYLGLTIETVSRTLTRLERNRVIAVTAGRTIRVTDPAALQQINA